VLDRLSRLFRRRPALSAEQQRALAACRAVPAVPASTPLSGLRWVVVDVETTGLDPFTDRLISIGAVELVGGKIPLNSGFEVVLRQPQSSARDNILVHGICGSTQRSGVEPASALLDFLGYAGQAPLLAFHADFDRTMIERATREALGMVPGNLWLDLALLAPALLGGPGEVSPQGLDEWTALAGIGNPFRHNALADALATAQLLQVVLARAGTAGARTLGDLAKIGKDQRWLGRGA
jgi:DNA polymerase III subunit epsilon